MKKPGIKVARAFECLFFLARWKKVQDVNAILKSRFLARFLKEKSFLHSGSVFISVFPLLITPRVSGWSQMSLMGTKLHTALGSHKFWQNIQLGRQKRSPFLPSLRGNLHWGFLSCLWQDLHKWHKLTEIQVSWLTKQFTQTQVSSSNAFCPFSGISKLEMKWNLLPVGDNNHDLLSKPAFCSFLLFSNA